MYQALYRKWRPQSFDEVIGQQHITQTLKNQVMNGRLSHAYLFIGTRGTGKTTCARILARAVNCEHPVNGNPCGVCPACVGIANGSVMDVVELDAASNNSVDNVRALREEAVFTPAEVRKRVYIIDEVHMLSTSAFNALLKILEEPPEHLMFILATTELQKVPATILSRCQRHSFKRIDTPIITEHLMDIACREKLALDRNAAELIARLAEGGVRDALSLLDQCSAREHIDLEAVYSAMGLAGNRRTAQMLDTILAHKTGKALKLFHAMWMDGKDPAVMLTELAGLLRDILMIKVAPNGAVELISGGYDTQLLTTLASKMTAEEIISAVGTLRNSVDSMRLNSDPKTAAELCIVSLCDSTLGESISQLRARVSRLEEQIKNGLITSSEKVIEAPVSAEPSAPCDPVPVQRKAEYDTDELDPEMFAEEQPEDAFLSRSEKSVQTAPPERDVPKKVDWKAICQKAAGSLPRDISLRLDDDKSVRGTLDGLVLRIEAAPGFVYGRFSRQDVLSKLAAAASELTGSEIRPMLSELSDSKKGTRSIEDLKQFKEVRFI